MCKMSVNAPICVHVQKRVGKSENLRNSVWVCVLYTCVRWRARARACAGSVARGVNA